jgi:hypothetical protein
MHVGRNIISILLWFLGFDGTYSDATAIVVDILDCMTAREHASDQYSALPGLSDAAVIATDQWQPSAID